MEEPDRREQPVLRADEDAHPVAFLGQFQKLDQVGLALDIVEQGADALQVGLGLDAVQQMRRCRARSAPFPGRARVARPFGHHLGGQGVQFALFAVQLGQDFGAGDVERAAAQPRAQIIAGFRQAPKPAGPAGVSMTRFSTWPSSLTMMTSALPGATATNSTCLRAAVLLGGDHQPGAARQARQGLGGLGQHILDAAGRCRTCALRWRRARPAPARRFPAARPRTGAGPFRWARGRRWCAGHRAGPWLPGRPSHCGSRPATGPGAGAGTGCASPPARPRPEKPPPDGGRPRAGGR